MASQKQLSTVKKYGIYAGGTLTGWLLLMGLFYLLVFGPQNTLMASLDKQFNESKEKYALAQTAGRHDTQIYQQEKLEVLGQKISNFITPADKAMGLMFHISQLATQHQLQNFSAKDRQLTSLFRDSTQARIIENWQELTFSGTFTQVASFLNSLERNEPVIFIETVEINRDFQKIPPLTAKVLISYLVEKKPEKMKSQTSPTGAGINKK